MFSCGGICGARIKADRKRNQNLEEGAVSMKKSRGILLGCAAMLLFSVLLTGCGSIGSGQGPVQNGLTVEKDGQVLLCIVDSFDKGYYDVDELREMAQSEVSAYNGANNLEGSGAVVLEEVSSMEGDGQQVRVVYRFSDGAAYSGFQKETLYYETVKEAVQLRHIFSGAVLFNGEDSITLDEENQKKLGDRHVLVTDASTRISLPYEVVYYSDGVRILEDGSADTSQCTEPAVLLLKK